MNVLSLINTRVGTDCEVQQSAMNGNVLPYTCVPFGMNHYVLETRRDDVRYFNPRDKTNFGWRLSHQPSPWMGDFAYVQFNVRGMTAEEMDIINNLADYDDQIFHLNQSSYQPKYATFQPGYLSWQNNRDRITHELIPTTRGATIRYTFPSNYKQIGIQSKAVVTIGISKTGWLEVSDDQLEVVGYTDQVPDSKNSNYGMYFKVKFKEAVELINKTAYTNNGEELMMYWFVLNDGNQNETILFKQGEIDITTSYISVEQAELNYNKDDFFNCDFNGKKEITDSKWLSYLNKIEVQHRNEEYVKFFYQALYRTATFPNVVHEYNEKGDKIYRSPYSNEIRYGAFYTNNGYWDTFRTNYPLYALIIPSKYEELIEGILNVAREDKFLPKWLSPDERGLMPGTLVDGVIADAVVKGIVSDEEVIRELLDAMLYTAETPSESVYEGREGQQSYEEYGYLPNDYKESVNKTLDYAYSDFCIAQVADYIGEKDIANKYANKYYKQSQSYRDIFNKEAGQMVSKDRQGNWQKNFIAHRWGGDYTEGSSWQTSLGVYHDMHGLIELYGGDDEFVEHLNHLVNQDPIYQVGSYEEDIHEITELSSVSFGQLALSNQPSFHIPYLYTYAGRPHYTQMLVKKLMLELFSNTYDGYVGDEDNGSMSAWYILSSLGLYQVTPGTTTYVLGISFWDSAVIYLENGNKITITSDKQEDYLCVVTERYVNEKVENKHYIDYSDLMKGIDIHQKLGVMPDYKPIERKYRPE